MRRHLTCGAIALTVALLATPATSRTAMVSRPVPEKASLTVVETSQGFAIVTSSATFPPLQQTVTRIRLGSSIHLDARLLDGSHIERSTRR